MPSSRATIAAWDSGAPTSATSRRRGDYKAQHQGLGFVVTTSTIRPLGQVRLRSYSLVISSCVVIAMLSLIERYIGQAFA